MIMLRKLTLSLLIIACVTAMATGQVLAPAASPSAKAIQKVGLTDIEIQYSRPGKKGREIFGTDGLVPYGKIWRTGANAATKITFSDDVKVAGKTLSKGSYAILSKPNTGSWAVHFYPYETGNWNSYVEKEPAVVVNAKSTKTPGTVETFTISIDDISMTGAHLVFAWENTRAAIPVGVEVHERVMASIEKVMAGPKANDYFQAASYMHESGGDLKKALAYIQKATKGDNAQFFQVRREALILADLGRKKEAIAAAKRSLELSKKAGNDDFVRLNEKSIKEWSK